MHQDAPPWTGEPIAIAPVYPGRDYALLETIVALYAAAFAAPPYRRTERQVAWFREALRRHTLRPGFTAFGASVDGKMIGFAYGYTTMPNHSWHRNVVRALGSRAHSWVTDCFVLAELAVHPDAQGYGIGRTLHDALLAAQPQPRAVLSTLDAPTPARVMYASAGWRLLADNVRFPKSTERYVIMGKLLGSH